MRRIFTTTAAIAVAGLATMAKADSESYDFSGFTRITVESGLDVEVRGGDAFSIGAEGTRRGIARLVLRQSGDTLIVTRKSDRTAWFSPVLAMADRHVTVRITLPELAAITAGSGSAVRVIGGYGNVFIAESRSGAGLNLTGITAGMVTLSASSGASLDASGRCGQLRAAASSGADLDARGLACDDAGADASSGADIALTAHAVSATASSGGDVDVFGAITLESEESSGGNVDRH